MNKRNVQSLSSIERTEACRQIMENKPSLPLEMISWIFGLGVIECPPGKPRRLLSLFYVAIILITYCILSIYSYSQVILMTREFETNQKIIKITFYSHIFLTLSTIILAWHRRKWLYDTVNRLRKVDQMLEQLGVAKKYSRIFKINIAKAMISLTYLTVIVTINSLLTFSRDSQKISPAICTSIVLNYPIVLMFIVDTAFINVVTFVKFKFRKLNKALKGMLTSTSDYPQHARIINRHFNGNDDNSRGRDGGTLECNLTYDIELARKIHLELIKICRIVDEAFGLHMLISIITSIAIMTGALYHIYVLVLYTHVSLYDFYRAILSTCTWFIYYSTKIYILSFSCSSTSDRAVATGDVICEFYDEPTNSLETKLEIRQFLHYLIKNPIEFKAFGFIAINFTLIQKVIGCVTTYLMILSQFGNFIS